MTTAIDEINALCADIQSDWILDAALRHARRFPDMAFMNLKNDQNAVRLVGF